MNERHLGKMILNQTKKYRGRNALFHKTGKNWLGISWEQMEEEIKAVSKALLEFGVKEGEMVAIFSHNCPEVTLCDFGILCIRGVSVPIYATNTAAQAEYIINDAKIRILFVGGKQQYDTAMKFFGSNKSLKKIIVFDSSVKIKSDKNIIYYKDLLEIGKKSKKEAVLKKRLASVKPGDLCTIMYTSGTTGDPKGVMLTHMNMTSDFEDLNRAFNLGENDIELCFLPLSHAYQKGSSYWVLSQGGTVYYCEDPKKIMEYFQEVKPTYMVGVPRLYEKMYGAIYDNLQKASPVKRALFNWAVETGKNYQYKKHGGKFVSPLLNLKHSIAFKLVLSKISALLGGRLHFFSAGGAPLAKEIEEFFFAANIFIAQGYGLTETSPVISFNPINNFKFGTVGRVTAECKVKIAEDGEILVKGGNVTQGYYKKPKQTKEAFTRDGWLMTGDIGYVDSDGFLHITDRKKDIIVTSGGKNVAPQNIESLYGKDPYIEQMAVIGDKRKFLTALVVPAFAMLENYAKEKNISYSSREDLVKNAAIIAFYRERIQSASDQLAQFEKIKKFTLMPKEFTQDAGEITPSMKIKRKVLMDKYRNIIEGMYRGE